MSWRSLAAALVASLGTLSDGWERVGPGLELAYPRDHGSHPAYRTEWWYLTGIVADAEGGRFGLQLTIFRSGLDPRPLGPGESPQRARQVLAGHLAIVDVARGRTELAERLRRTGTPLATASADDLDVVLEDWSLAREPNDRLIARAGDPATGIGLALELVPEKPLVLHGDRGVSAKGGEPGNASAYASWTRLAVAGELTVEGRPRRVDGEAWFDHEFGSSVLGQGVEGWDWFGLRLADGRELMLFELRRADGARASAAGTLVEDDGSARSLGPDDFAIEPTGRWTSPESGATYPSGWRVTLPAHGLELELAPLVRDAELATEGSTRVTYWEGPVAITGSALGEGYAELTGYAETMAERF